MRRLRTPAANPPSVFPPALCPLPGAVLHPLAPPASARFRRCLGRCSDRPRALPGSPSFPRQPPASPRKAPSRGAQSGVRNGTPPVCVPRLWSVQPLGASPAHGVCPEAPHFSGLGPGHSEVPAAVRQTRPLCLSTDVQAPYLSLREKEVNVVTFRSFDCL